MVLSKDFILNVLYDMTNVLNKILVTNLLNSPLLLNHTRPLNIIKVINLLYTINV